MPRKVDLRDDQGKHATNVDLKTNIANSANITSAPITIRRTTLEIHECDSDYLDAIKVVLNARGKTSHAP
jgi:hypothetical protein